MSICGVDFASIFYFGLSSEASWHGAGETLRLLRFCKMWKLQIWGEAMEGLFQFRNLKIMY